MPSSWLSAEAPGGTPFERVLGLRRELREGVESFFSLLWTHGGLEPSLLEICRLRVAQLLACEAELSRRTPGAALPEEKREALESWLDCELFSDTERACLALVEKFVLDPQSVTDADAAAVAAHLSPKETVALAEALALFDGFSRFQTILEVRPDGEAQASPRGQRISSPKVEMRNRLEDPRPPGGPGGSRVPPPPPTDSTDPMDRSILAHQPELMRAFFRLYGALWDGVVDHPTKEVARLRNARVTNCGYCKNVRFATAREQGLSEELVAQIGDHFEQSALSPRHKLVIRYADVFLTVPSAIDRSLKEEMQREFRDEEIVELTAGLALFMGFSKIAVVLGTAPRDMPTTVIPTPSRRPA